VHALNHRRFPRREAFLFLIAILVPCLVLIAFGLHMIGQERQLEGRRRDEQQRRLLIQAGQELFKSLEKQKLQEIKRVVSGNARTTPRLLNTAEDSGDLRMSSFTSK